MFSERILNLNSKIKNLSSLSRTEMVPLFSDLNVILKENLDSFENELDKRKILNKIKFLNFNLRDPLKSIEKYRIEDKYIIVTLKDKKEKKIKIKKITAMVEMYFLIKPNDEMYKTVCLYFLSDDNFFKLHFYDLINP